MTQPVVSFEFAPEGLRKCGSCTLCCKLVPVPELEKPAGQRCEHQRSTGCRIYPRRPGSCRFWNCRWLANADAADLSRPDRAHYVIDIMPDYVIARPDDGGADTTIPVVQVWVDPAYPDAHRDPALRAFLARRGEEGYAAMIRYSSGAGFLLAPPAMSDDGQWHECINTSVSSSESHSFDDIARKLSGSLGNS
jgi:hypothetical protein